MSSLTKEKKRVSIRTKIFIGVGLFVILNIILNLIIVKVSINDIYLSLEKRELKKTYNLVKKNLNDETNIEDVIYEASDNGMKIKVLDQDYNILYTIFNDKMGSQFTELDNMLLSKISDSNEKFITLKNYKRSGYDLHYIGYYNDNYIIISSSIESLKKDARTTIVVLILSSLFVFLILLLFAYFISKLFSKKINEIKEVTDDISSLNFDKKIDNISNDELGDLFTNINVMSNKLEKSINELEVANKKLKEDLREKEKQEIARKKLIANISHEFKTPLTIISGYSQLLNESIKNKEDKESLGLIINETERLGDLVHEFLELSRLESDNVNLKKEEIDVKELIEKFLKKMNVRLSDKNINLSTKYASNNVILADLKQFNRVIENIITNAIKFCSGDKNIIIKTYIKDKYYNFEVYNSGANIKDKDLENIFNSYYKDKSARNKEGTGLGLTIVKAIVDLHGGNCVAINVKDGVKFIIKMKI